ncbi:MAG TPA: hypothetical protein VFR24_25115 [Candidatus Angelobacter sp.]|nr:hypothetical protein [Candidatus Angelobacter sp.]
MNPITVSELYCPFESDINPHIKQVQDSASQWMQETGLAKNERIYSRAKHENHAALVAYMMPDAALVDLQLAADAMTWFFAHDDYMDGVFQGGHTDLEHMQRQFLDACNCNTSETLTDPLSRGLHDICRRIAMRSGYGWLQCFRGDVLEYLQAIGWERALRTASVVPDLETYMLLRPVAGTVHMVFSLTAALNDISWDASFLRHLCIRKLADLAGLQMTFYNDVWSFQRDLNEGHSFNLISVLQKENCITVNEAAKLAVSLTNKQALAFLSTKGILPHFGLDKDPVVRRYITALENLMSGHRNWMMQTPRFNMHGCTAFEE